MKQKRKATMSIRFGRLLLLLLIACTTESGRAQTTTNNATGTAATGKKVNLPKSDEQYLASSIPELTWSKDFMVKNGWLKPGQDPSKKTSYFSKKNYPLLGATGEVQFLFEEERLFNFAFYVDTDDDFSTVYQHLRKGLTASEKRSGDAATGSRIEFQIQGEKSYKVAFVRRIFGKEIERSLEIDIHVPAAKNE